MTGAGRGIRTPACGCTDAVPFKISRRPPYQAWLSRQGNFVIRPNIVNLLKSTKQKNKKNDT